MAMQFMVVIICLAFFFEITDSAAGMGYGTALTPILIILGYSPLQIVPAILVTESITGFIDAFFDHELQNVSFKLRPMSDAAKFAVIMGLFGCGAIFSSIILVYYAIKLDSFFVKFYISLLLLLMGVVGIIRIPLKKRLEGGNPNLRKMVGFAALAGFNKGIGGGGYGPVITMGQIFSGVYEKSATAIVSFSEAMVSIVGVLTFFLISNIGITIDLILLPSLLTGAFFGALITPYLVRIMPNKLWQNVIPIYAFGIGIYSILNIF